MPYKPPLPEEQREAAVRYLKFWIGVPYLWGGDDFSGFDCSGLMVEVLQSVGLLEHRTDYRARDLYSKFRNQKTNTPKPGCLVFWLVDFMGDRIAGHVEMLVDEFHVIGASGGGGDTKTLKDAIKYNAFVKQRPIYYRDREYEIMDPFLDE